MELKFDGRSAAVKVAKMRNLKIHLSANVKVAKNGTLKLFPRGCKSGKMAKIVPTIYWAVPTIYYTIYIPQSIERF